MHQLPDPTHFIAESQNGFPQVVPADVGNRHGVLHDGIKVLVQVWANEVSAVGSKLSLNLGSKERMDLIPILRTGVKNV